MKQESRLKKSLLNARVNLIFCLLTLFVSFFTRKVFLDKLGDDFIGLTTTIKNLLSFLNLAELGIGSAIAYVLYRPIFDRDYQKLNEIISLFGYIYRWVGLIILAVGAILSLFLPLIFRDIPIDISVVYYLYYSFLFSSLLGYFVNYKQTLLSADQKNYVVTTYLKTTLIVKTALQAALAYYTQNYYIWATNEIVFGIILSIILNWRIAKTYPWLESDIKLGRGLLKKYPDVFKYTKQLFVHKIAGLAQTQLTPFLVYAFVSLQKVAMYGNYIIITSCVNNLVNQLLGSTSASVGNLIAEGDKARIQKVYWELFAIRMFVAGVVTFSVYHLITPFVCLWLGSEYLLSDSILILILINLFIGMTRGATDVFKYGYALFSDVWAPIAESVIFVVAAIIGGTLWGFEGLLLGGIASLFVIVWGWQPIFLFRSGFEISISNYFIPFLKYIFVFVICFVTTTHIINNYINFIDATDSYYSWTLYSVVVVSIFSIIYLTVLYLTSRGIRDSVARLIKLK